MAKYPTQQEMLFEIYMASIKEGDLNLALEVADKLWGVAVEVPDERIAKFIAMLDDAVQAKENHEGREPYTFEYGGQNFEVKIL